MAFSIKNFFKKYFLFFSPIVPALGLIGFIAFMRYWNTCYCNYYGFPRYAVPIFAFIVFALILFYGQFLYMVVGALIKDANSEYMVGVSYLKGQFVRKNYAKALKWLGRAADQKHTLARYYLSNMHMDGKGIPQNTVTAERIMQQMAEDGGEWSLRTVAVTCQYNFGYKKDYVRSYAWLCIGMLKATTYKNKYKFISLLRRLTAKMTAEQIQQGELLYSELAPFAEAATQPAPRVRIVSAPNGRAPAEVREKWIGCELPLLCANAELIKTWVTYYTPPTGCISFWWDVLRGRVIRQKGFPVDSKTALEILGRSNIDAKNWYVENMPHVNHPWTVMFFEASSCSLIEPGINRSAQ